MERWLEAEIQHSIAQLYRLAKPMKDFKTFLSPSFKIMLRIRKPLAKMKSE